MLRNFTLILCLISFLSVALKAQTAENKVLTGISATFMDYKGIVNKQYFNPKNFNPGVRISANMYMNPWMNYSLGASFVPRASYPQVDGTFNPQLLIDVNTGFQLKSNNGKILDEEASVAPYIYTGLGYSTSEGKSGVYLPGALGVRFRLGKLVSLNIESMYRVKFNSNIQPMSHTVGFNFVLPSQKPSVEMAARGKKNNSPAPKAKPVITSKPKQEETVEEKEEVTASETTSTPNTDEFKEEVVAAEPKVENELVDTDADGVADKYDPCPTLAGPKAQGGCPERDRVGTADDEVVASIVPDADGDGVEDAFDPCPNVPGPKSEGGCPERFKVAKASELNSALNPMPSATVDNSPPPAKEIPSSIIPREISGATDTEETPVTSDREVQPAFVAQPAQEEVPVTPTETKETTEEVAETPSEETAELTEQSFDDQMTGPQQDQVEESQQAVDIYDMSRLKIIAMNMIYKPGTDALVPESDSYVQELKDLLAKYPGYKLIIRGYYNAGNEEDDNKVMSVKRAFQIKRKLILEKGMPPVRMSPDGFGSSQTTTKNESRIELELVPLNKK